MLTSSRCEKSIGGPNSRSRNSRSRCVYISLVNSFCIYEEYTHAHTRRNIKDFLELVKKKKEEEENKKEKKIVYG